MTSLHRSVRVGDSTVGRSHPCYIVAEIGINHNGDMGTVRKLIDAAAVAGCDAVKFQKRTPEICVPEDQRRKERETPWGAMTYMDYRERIELGEEDYAEVEGYCREKGLAWFASPWDLPSVDFLERFDPVCHKIASACLTDVELLRRVAACDRPVILSTGMSTMDQIRAAVEILGTERLIVTHCTSAYPCTPAELNLRMIPKLMQEFPCPVGYSGHEVGLQTTVAAVALGACLVERHITLDRAMWGSDQAASVEPWGFMRLVRDIRVVEAALGDGEKRVYPSEMPLMERLRR